MYVHMSGIQHRIGVVAAQQFGQCMPTITHCRFQMLLDQPIHYDIVKVISSCMQYNCVFAALSLYQQKQLFMATLF